MLEASKPPPPPDPNAKPKTKGERQGHRGFKQTTETYFQKLKREDPEKLSQMARVAATSPARKANRHLTHIRGNPRALSNHEVALGKDKARKIAHRIYTIMDKEGSLPENPIARKAMKAALEMLAEDNATKDKMAIIRTLLEYNMAKPAATQNVNLKTAEDFLDELAAAEDGKK